MLYYLKGYKGVIMGFTRALILGVIILSTSSLSFAVEDQRILGYIQFITEWSSYKYNNEPLPKIRTASPGMLQVYKYGDYAVAQAEYKGETLRSVMAVYDPTKNELLVSKNIDLVDEASSGPTLVHELVHYLQDINGKTALYGDDKLVCLEGEAYDIQALWQVVNKVRPEEYSAIQHDILLSFMKCEQSYKKTQ